MDQNNMNQNENMNRDMNEKKASEGNSKNGLFWTVFVVVILVFVGVWIWSGNTAPTTPSDTATSTDGTSTTTEPELGEDSPQDIQDQLEGINIEDLEGEFENIDQDLQQLEGTATN